MAEVFKEFYGQHQDDWPVLCIEPGRAIVGDAGIPLARVTGIKKSYKNFIGLIKNYKFITYLYILKNDYFKKITYEIQIK